MTYKFDLSLSLDVIYHLVDDNIYEKYMNDLLEHIQNIIIWVSVKY